MIAGTVLLSAGPFRVGDRVRLQGGPIAGQIDGIVSSLGLLYTTFATDEGIVTCPTAWCSMWPCSLTRAARDAVAQEEVRLVLQHAQQLHLHRRIETLAREDA